MIIPEFSIFNVLEMFLNVTRQDYSAAATDQDSFLYKLFNEDEYTTDLLGIERYKFFEQAKKILIENKGKDALSIRIGYNLEKLPPVCLHIMMPNDSPNPAEIGDGVGYVDSIQETIEGEVFNREFKSSTNSSNYNILITSTNMIEVVLIYHWLKAMLLIFREQLEFRGLRNANFGGSDINFDESIVPPHIYHRNLNLSFVYDFSVPAFHLKKIAQNFNISGSILADELSQFPTNPSTTASGSIIAPESDLDKHLKDFDNPHKVADSQIENGIDYTLIFNNNLL